MAYRNTYLRIHTVGYVSHWANENAQAAFKEESRRLFQELGWSLVPGGSGICDTVTKDRQDLYLHPTSFSGVLDETNIQPLQAYLSKAQTFQCYAYDCYEEYKDLSDEEYRAELEAKRGEITDFILKQCRTKRSNLYIVAPIAACVAEQFEICRLCDKDRHNKVGHQFAAELMDQLLQKGWLVTAETSHGEGIRTVTAKERNIVRQSTAQLDGQIVIGSGEGQSGSPPLKKKHQKLTGPSL